MIYGFLREHRLETVVPIPALFKVEVVGKKTRTYVEKMGDDCEKFMPLTQKKWTEARDKTIKYLESVGLGPRQTHHLKKWALHRDGAGWKAFLIDLGNCSLRTSTVSASKGARDKLRLQPCP